MYSEKKYIFVIVKESLSQIHRMSYYPYGSVPGQGYVQPGVQPNPAGYVSPVTSPFHQLMVNHGVSKMISGMAGSSSSYSSSSDATIVTYDSYMKNKEFSKNVLKLSEQDLKDHGPPFGIKYKDCEVVIPLPSKRSVCNAVNNKVTDLMKSTGRTLTDVEKKEVMLRISENLATEFFGRQCGIDCNPFQPAQYPASKVAAGISSVYGVQSAINRVTGLSP